MRIHLRGQRLWVYLTGKRPCPPRPVLPTEPIFSANATEDVQRATVAAFEDALEEYQTQLHAYEVWNDGDAKASAIVVASIEPEHASDVLGLSTAKEMWDRLRAHYEPKNETLYLSALREEQSLAQQDATADAFYQQLVAVWRQAVSLRPDVCQSCTCCVRQQAHLETRRLHKFLICLRPEYGVAHSQLLMRQPLPSILEALAAVQAEETHLRTAGILQQPSSIFVVHTPTPVPPPPSTPVAAAAASTDLHCDYYDRSGHTVQYCR